MISGEKIIEYSVTFLGLGKFYVSYKTCNQPKPGKSTQNQPKLPAELSKNHLNK